MSGGGTQNQPYLGPLQLAPVWQGSGIRFRACLVLRLAKNTSIGNSGEHGCSRKAWSGFTHRTCRESSSPGKKRKREKKEERVGEVRPSGQAWDWSTFLPPVSNPAPIHRLGLHSWTGCTLEVRHDLPSLRPAIIQA